jgi:hypothetical protein
MTEPSEVSSVTQSPDDLRALIGTQVRVLRDGALEGTGELLEVIGGDLGFYNTETSQPDSAWVEDKTLHWADVAQGDQVASRRYSNRWQLEPVAE